MNDIKIGVIGGDKRQLVMAYMFAGYGCEVAVYGIDTENVKNELKYYSPSVGSENITRAADLCAAIRHCDIVILPLPLTVDNIRINCPMSNTDIKIGEVFACMTPGQLAAGGRISDAVFELAKKSGVLLYDYYEREELAILNAIPTAEGAVAIAMSELPITVYGSNALVIGYGRVGHVVARTLLALGANVTVSARKHEDFAWIRANGCKYTNTEKLSEFDFTGIHMIFNTVPALVLPQEVLKRISPNTLIVELASKPGGIDTRAASELGINVVWALSLPGKVAPVTSGEIIAESVINIMNTNGVKI